MVAVGFASGHVDMVMATEDLRVDPVYRGLSVTFRTQLEPLPGQSPGPVSLLTVLRRGGRIPSYVSLALALLRPLRAANSRNTPCMCSSQVAAVLADGRVALWTDDGPLVAAQQLQHALGRPLSLRLGERRVLGASRRSLPVLRSSRAP